MCVGVEWENGEPLGGEKFPLLPGANDDRSAGFRTARRDPGDEFSAAPPNAECGMRSAEFQGDRKSTRLNSSHEWISYAVFCLKTKKSDTQPPTERAGR